LLNRAVSLPSVRSRTVAAQAATEAGSLNSRWIGSTPSRASMARSSGLRAVANTRQPRACMVLAEARPMPEEQPVMRTERGVIAGSGVRTLWRLRNCGVSWAIPWAMRPSSGYVSSAISQRSTLLVISSLNANNDLASAFHHGWVLDEFTNMPSLNGSISPWASVISSTPRK
jgi:hypothetical protein